MYSILCIIQPQHVRPWQRVAADMRNLVISTAMKGARRAQGHEPHRKQWMPGQCVMNPQYHYRLCQHAMHPFGTRMQSLGSASAPQVGRYSLHRRPAPRLRWQPLQHKIRQLLRRLRLLRRPADRSCRFMHLWSRCLGGSDSNCRAQISLRPASW